MVEIHFEDVEVLDVIPEFFVSWLNSVVTHEGCLLGEVSLIFCSDDYLLDLNRKYLNHDYYTDIITFDYSESGIVSGDLFISIDRVRENSAENGVMVHMELKRVVVHGVLHLLGYKDKTVSETKLMRDKENWALGLIVPRET